MIKKYIKARLRSAVSEFINLERLVVELNDYKELMKLFSWQQNPLLDIPQIHEFNSEVDINGRRIRDAECLGTVVRNERPGIILEIGTASGLGTTLMSINSPNSQIYTLNIAPEEIMAGKGGVFTTIALKRGDIGIEYRKRNLKNIKQIFVNTADWEPSFSNIDFAFIDGCHDADFVVNDTKKCLNCMKPGSFILWHDFNLNLIKKYNWVYSVCSGVELLCRESIIKGRIYTIKDSWTGIYKVK